jgi:hypothetical protein
VWTDDQRRTPADRWTHAAFGLLVQGATSDEGCSPRCGVRTVDVVETQPVPPADDDSQELTPELRRLMADPRFNTAAWVGLQLRLGRLEPCTAAVGDEPDYEPDAKVGGS